MNIKMDHLAIWTSDLEKARAFYQKYFDMQCGARYYNPVKQFSSYFLSFPQGAVRLELMHRPDIANFIGKRGVATGLAHIAIAVGSKERVDVLTERLRSDGYVIEGEPRTTGDGYYESLILDPEGNLIEITE